MDFLFSHRYELVNSRGSDILLIIKCVRGKNGPRRNKFRLSKLCFSFTKNIVYLLFRLQRTLCDVWTQWNERGFARCLYYVYCFIDLHRYSQTPTRGVFWKLFLQKYPPDLPEQFVRTLRMCTLSFVKEKHNLLFYFLGTGRDRGNCVR